jgi:ElaB/YqjD/DUF883 family membrane-anchored ribosome-binding protein
MDDRLNKDTATGAREGAASLRSVADTLHDAARRLDDGGSGFAARYADRAADQVDHFADRLKDATVRDMLNETERFARRHPEAFIGLAVATGFLAVRFLKSSTSRARASNDLDAAVRNADVAGLWPKKGVAAPPPEPVRATEGTLDPSFTPTPAMPAEPTR